MNFKIYFSFASLLFCMSLQSLELKNEIEPSHLDEDLIMATIFNDLDKIEDLVRRGANVNSFGDNNNLNRRYTTHTPLMITIINAAGVEKEKCKLIIKFFLEQPNIDLSIRGENGRTAFDFAKDRPEILEILNQHVINKFVYQYQLLDNLNRQLEVKRVLREIFKINDDLINIICEYI